MNYQGDSSDFRAVKQKVSGMKGMTAQQIQQQAAKGGFSQSNNQPAAGTASGTAASAAGTAAQAATPSATALSNEVKPSSNYKSFDHSAYTVTYPDNWTISGDANSSVTIAPKGGASGDAVTYGMIISGAQVPQGTTLEAATSQLASQIQQQNSLKPLGNGENFTLNGKPARSIVFQGSSPIQGEQERDWLVTQQRQDGTLMYIVFVSPEKDFKSLQPSFEKMLRSFKMK
jgi:hypothetical protein